MTHFFRLSWLVIVVASSNAGVVGAQDLPAVVNRLQQCELLESAVSQAILEGIYRQHSNNRFTATKTQWRMAGADLCQELTRALATPFSAEGRSVDSEALLALADRTPGVRKTEGSYESASTATTSYYETSLGEGARWTVVRTVAQELNYYEDMNRIVRSEPTALNLEGLADLFAPFPREHHRLMRMAKLPWWELERGRGRWRLLFGRPDHEAGMTYHLELLDSDRPLLKSLTLTSRGNYYHTHVDYSTGVTGGLLEPSRIVVASCINGKTQIVTEYAFSIFSYNVRGDDIMIKAPRLHALQDDLTNSMLGAEKFSSWPQSVLQHIYRGEKEPK